MPQDKKIIYEKELEENDEPLNRSEQKIKKLKTKLKKCQQEKEEYLTGWQRSQADFINYKKKWEKKLSGWQEMVNQGFIAELLPALDSLGAIKSKIEDGPKFIKGIDGIRKQLLEILKKQGLAEIKSIGQNFNPEFHEAVETVKPEKGEEGGMVVEEIQKGYLFNGRVIRTAKVRVVK